MERECPWDGLTPGTVEFCEARKCDWVAEPSNAWSSVAYVLVAAWIASTHTRRAGDPRLWVLGCAQALIGVGSFAFHATGSFAGELVDQVGMFMLSCLILAFVVGRLAGLSAARTAALYVAMTAGSALFLLIVPPAGIPLFAIQLVAGLAGEVHAYRSAADRGAFRHLFQGLGLFGLSFVIWGLDISRVVCNPDNHLVTGHAVWHVLNAVSIERLYRFYAASFANGRARV